MDTTAVKRIFLFVCTIGILISCTNNQNTLKIRIENKSEITLEDYALLLSLDSISAKLPSLIPDHLYIIDSDNEVLPYQVIKNKDGNFVLTLINLSPGETKTLNIKSGNIEDNPEFKKRTHAEISVKTGGKFVNNVYEGGGEFISIDSLRVPDECTDHSFYIKYEGPGWESDKVAYRLYLDWRNAVDIFGKITTDVALPGVGLDGYDSYHEISDWGMDILKVGNSLGMGSIGTWTGEKAERVAKTDSIICKIKEDGDLFSEFKTKYYNWQSANGNVNLTSKTSIMAGSRMTKQKLYIDGDIKNIATGIVKHNDIPLMKGPADTKWGYIATWGLQSLNDDNLGMVVFFKNEDVMEITEDDLSYVVVLNPSEDKMVKYYYAAVWEKENGKTITKEDFKTYLEQSLIVLERPVEISW